MDLLTVHVIDKLGNLAVSCRIATPEAHIRHIDAVAVSPRKTIAASAGAIDSEGRLAALLLFADSTGKITRLVRTNPFATGSLLFLPDGRLLCVGREFDDQLEDVDGHNILRVYSPDGVLLSKALNVNLLRPNKRELHPLDWMLVPGNDRIGVLERESFRYAEVDPGGALVRPLGTLGIDPPAMVTGAALLSNGDRLVSVQHGQVAKGRVNYGYSFRLWKFKDSFNGVVRREVTEIMPPEGATGLRVLGVHEDEVVFLAASKDRLVFTQQPL